MDPKISYIIWFTPRTGSTHFCDLLTQSGVAGNPGEFFNKDEKVSLLNHYGHANYSELKSHLWKIGGSVNGVMGMKYSLNTSSYLPISEELQRLQNISADHYLDWNVLKDLFPECKHIYLSRRHKIRVAVSWWKAIVDNQWHLKSGESRKQNEDYYRDKFNLDALEYLLKENAVREVAMQDFFDHNQITPLTIMYEDLISQPQGSVQMVLDYLGLEVPDLSNIKNTFRRTSDEISEAWVTRFRGELQEKWDKVIW